MPGGFVVALVLLFYVGVGLALPLALGFSALGIVIDNFFGTVLAGLVILSWLGAQLEAAHRRHLLDWTTDLRRLEAEEFEWLMGEVFRRDGWKVRETGHQDRADGNIDLELTRDRQRMIAQCKRWESWQVPVEEIREFAGTLMREALPAGAGIFVTLSDFTSQARAEAKKIGIALIDKYDLHDRIEKARRIEPCPVCRKPMRLDYSSQGWWFHCVAGCPGKRDLGKDPGRAVEFLTQPPTT
ncbi:MAG: restriction endonuclease [Dehalococcoidia bacterium]